MRPVVGRFGAQRYDAAVLEQNGGLKRHAPHRWLAVVG
jgi:hypothetical protein